MATALKIESIKRPLELVKNSYSAEQSTEILFEMMGWKSLPNQLKAAIQDDVIMFNTEIYAQYVVIDPEQVVRKKRVCYWINQYKAGNCSVSLATEMLQV